MSHISEHVFVVSNKPWVLLPSKHVPNVSPRTKHLLTIFDPSTLGLEHLSTLANSNAKHLDRPRFFRHLSSTAILRKLTKMPGGRGRGGPMPREVQVSKALSKLLRHSAEKEGLQLDEAGYINLKDVVGLKRSLFCVSEVVCLLSNKVCYNFDHTSLPHFDSDTGS